MPLLEWKNDYSVGVKEIDSQHKRLIEITNTLFDAMKEGKGGDVLKPILTELTDYTRTHFAYEERLLGANAYPDLVTHQGVHRQLADKVQRFADEANQGKIALSTPLISFLRSWLVDHIQGVDKRYSSHLSARGVR